MPVFPETILPSDPETRALVASYVLGHEAGDMERGGWFVRRGLGHANPPKAATEGLPDLAPSLRKSVAPVLDWWARAARARDGIEAAAAAVSMIAMPEMSAEHRGDAFTKSPLTGLEDAVSAAARALRGALWRALPEDARRDLASRVLTSVAYRALAVEREANEDAAWRPRGSWANAAGLLEDCLAVDPETFARAGHDPAVHGRAPLPRGKAA